MTRHRSTTAHLCSAYPFHAQRRFAGRGVYLGTDILSGGGGFAFDPFEAYRSGLVTNPNMLLAGEPGIGKSATAKVFVARSVAVFGRWVAIADPRAEYLPLAEALGLSVIRLHPGGTQRINPLEPGPGDDEGAEETGRRQSAMLEALLGSVLRRDLSPVEDAALGLAVTYLARRRDRSTATLNDLAQLLAHPTTELADATHTSPTELAQRVEALYFGIGKLLDRSLRGMFDGATNVPVDWNGPGIVLDLSAVHHDDDALRLVMIAATAWLQAILSRPDGPRRIQVLDEAWRLLSSERTTRYLQACWKLCRQYGVANIAIVHRLSDLRAQADDGTATNKVSMGLLADTQTRILFRQSTDQIPDATELLGLTTTEATLLPTLAKGRALWKIAGHTSIVQHEIAPGLEATLVNTDAQMLGTAAAP